ncbi:Nicotinic acetylcholine receptor beta 3 (Dbeta3) subunit [Strongyloides ratti]|uniref:Nicotinic acetylcholine receptor beta 3 (Dbeta3) subunit n=1 Tax=Strongyloides ratti TaxID=34506 RepID=A0A090LCW7_STRRB|nr:Nicotinic acetylcholine receptor beta 3 (Dbeta3) subunit [Strongyloides ratti]CEF67602.1 Nicotinic acetylcholine receptor beta 3 (Dbeta3) subunit [Strongyloides ratti]
MKILFYFISLFVVFFFIYEEVTAENSISVTELQEGTKVIEPGQESKTSDIEIINFVNTTYGEDSSNLHKAIFQNYSRKVIPVRNISTHLDVYVYLYINHLTVNQNEQTMTIHGQLYSTWTDEFAVWNPNDFNNIRQTYARYWDIWTPDFRVANSAGGIYSYFDINKRTHATLVYLGANKTKVEITPTFSIKIGCIFDFSKYPFDEQTCSIRLYLLDPISRLKIKVYYDLNPTIHLSWGHKDNKTVISEWEFISVTNNITYFIDGNYSLTPPRDPAHYDFSWSLYSCYIKVRRFSGYFLPTCILPFVTCWLLNTSTFFIHERQVSICIALINLIIQSVFINDTIYQIPTTSGGKPIYTYCLTTLMITSAITLFVHLIINIQKKVKKDENSYELQSIVPNIFDDSITKYLICYSQEINTKPPKNVSSLARGMPEMENISNTETSSDTLSNSIIELDEKPDRNYNKECCTLKLRYVFALLHVFILVVLIVLIYF